MRYLGLDVGDVRIGVALSDETATISSGLDTVRRVGPRKDCARIAGLAAEHGAGEIVVGLPRNMDGSVGPQARKVLDFIDALKRRVTIPVVAWDERMTSMIAERALVESGLRRSRRKDVVDKVSATLILQNYLDYRKLAEPEAVRREA